MFIITSLFPTKNNYRRSAESPSLPLWFVLVGTDILLYLCFFRERHAFHPAHSGKHINNIDTADLSNLDVMTFRMQQPAILY